MNDKSDDEFPGGDTRDPGTPTDGSCDAGNEPVQSNLAAVVAHIMARGLGRRRAGFATPSPWSIVELAIQLGITEDSVRGWLKGGGMSQKSINAFAALAASGHPATEIEIRCRLKNARDADRERRRKPKSTAPRFGRVSFCLPGRDTFNPKTLSCTGSRSEFPFGTREVMMSVPHHHMMRHAPFERRWYRNGKFMFAKKDVLSEPWKGFTFLYDWKGLTPGVYTVRLLCCGAVRTGSFRVTAERDPHGLRTAARLLGGLAFHARRTLRGGRVEGRNADWTLESGPNGPPP